MFSNNQPKFECQSSSYKRDKEHTILCYVDKAQVKFALSVPPVDLREFV